jgi:hypothetical protein
MANQYSVEIHQFISQKIAKATNRKKEALEKDRMNSSEKKFMDGRASLLHDFQDFLHTNYIPKLPRRIRQTFLNRDN